MSATVSQSATVASVACSTTVATLLAASGSRKGATVYNNAAVDLYVKFGSAASSTDFTVKLGPGDYFEVPVPTYGGIITGTLASSTGNALVTSW